MIVAEFAGIYLRHGQSLLVQSLLLVARGRLSNGLVGRDSALIIMTTEGHVADLVRRCCLSAVDVYRIEVLCLVRVLRYLGAMVKW